jgi:hypothetical protein
VPPIQYLDCQFRTFDVQCLDKKDFDLLTINLKELIGVHEAPPVPVGSPTPTESELSPREFFLNDAARSNSGQSLVSLGGTKRKKVVRFSYTESEEPDSVSTNLSNHDEMAAPTVESTPVPLSVPVPAHGVPVTVPVIATVPVPVPVNVPVTPPRTPSPGVSESAVSALLTLSDEDLGSQIDDHKSPVMASSLRMTSSEALQIGVILAEQERRFGTNMYISLLTEDEPMVEKYCRRGLTNEEAILRVFEKKYMSKAELKAIGRSLSMECDALTDNAEVPTAVAIPVGKGSHDLDDEKDDDSIDLLHENYAPFDDKNGSNNNNNYERKSVFMSEVLGSRNVPTVNSEQPVLAPAVLAVQTPHSTDSPPRIGRVSSTDALQLGLLLAQQESQFGTNMYESLTTNDEDELHRIKGSGLTTDQAALDIFRRKYGVPTGDQPLVVSFACITFTSLHSPIQFLLMVWFALNYSLILQTSVPRSLRWQLFRHPQLPLFVEALPFSHRPPMLFQTILE